MRRRRKQLAACLALVLIAAAWGGLAYRSGGSRDAREGQATQAAPVPVSAPRQVSVRPQRPAKHVVKARAALLAPDSIRELDAAPVAAAPPPPRRPSLKLLESIASFDSAAPADGAPAPAPDAPMEGADRRYLVFVNQCDDQAPASAEYRRCRAAEVRRLAFACGFYQRELRTVAYARAGDAEGWMQAYCHKMDAYKAAAR